MDKSLTHTHKMSAEQHRRLEAAALFCAHKADYGLMAQCIGAAIAERQPAAHELERLREAARKTLSRQEAGPDKDKGEDI